MGIQTAIYSHLVGAYGVTFTAAAGTDLLTASGHGRVNGDKVRVSSTGTLPGGLSANTDYFVRDVSGSTFKLAETSGGAAIDITSAGTGTHSLGTAVSDLVANRIHPGHAPQGSSPPYIVYRRISSIRFPHMAGASGLVRDRFQFDLYGSTAASVEAVRDALRSWLDGYDKAMGTESLDVRLVTLENVTDTPVPPQHGSELAVHNTAMDFFFTFAESIPAH